MAVMEIFVFTPFLLFFYFKGTVFTVIDCADTGIWWNWPWHKLHLSTSYLRPINISGEIFLCVCVCVNEVMLVGEKKINVSFCFAAHTQLQVCLEWALWQMTRCCAPTWCNAPQVHISLNLGFSGKSTKCFVFCFFLLLFCCLSFVLKFSSCHKYTVYR